MPASPKLKTGAVAQYPAQRSLHFQNEVLRFVNGTTQRYRNSRGPLHAWEIRLEALDETEMAALEELLDQSQGQFGTFTFTDPWDGRTYPNCSFGSDALDLTSLREMQGGTSLTVIENR